MATWVYLVRHGQTVWNEEGRLCGRSDIPLSEEGIRQACKVAERLAKLPLTAVYASPLLRARQTAEIIASFHQLPVCLEPDLREVDYGEWEGMRVVEVAERSPELEKLRWEAPMQFTAPGGEPMAQFAQRVIGAVQRIVAAHPHATLCVVAHQTVNRFILCWALQMDFPFWRRLRQDPACVNLLQVQEDGTWRIALINDTCHLKKSFGSL
ncbi:MAG: hypothetical protein IMHGJWDQ_001783 [Candidatus Fervidibacter sp.]